MKSRGGVGARSLNIELQGALNPAGERKVERSGLDLRAGRQGHATANDYEKGVYNGDSGLSRRRSRLRARSGGTFDGRAVSYACGDLDT